MVASLNMCILRFNNLTLIYLEQIFSTERTICRLHVQDGRQVAGVRRVRGGDGMEDLSDMVPVRHVCAQGPFLKQTPVRDDPSVGPRLRRARYHRRLAVGRRTVSTVPRCVLYSSNGIVFRVPLSIIIIMIIKVFI